MLVPLITSCYDDYIKDFDYNSVYFTYQYDVRTFVVGEGMKIDFGVVLGGIMENKKDLTVEYEIEPALLTPEILIQMKAGASYIKDAVSKVSNLQLLPTDYYSITDAGKLVIKAGQHSGKATIRPDSVNFLTDENTIIANYALPFLITKSDADSILQGKHYSVIGLKYENMLFGNYWHGGVTVVKDASGTIKNTIRYYTTIPSPEATVWNLKTVAPFELTVNGYSNIKSNKPELKISIDDGNIIISSAEGSTFDFTPDGANTFNQAKLLQNRKLYLNYMYQDSEGDWCYAADTLTFRNRIRDGVNEWQDENPSHY